MRRLSSLNELLRQDRPVQSFRHRCLADYRPRTQSVTLAIRLDRKGNRIMRVVSLFSVFTTVMLLGGTAAASQGQTPEPDTREATVEQAQAEKAKNLHPYVPSRGERLITELSNAFVNVTTKW